jgi:RNA polymerase sigma factor (sigma-70 family)
VAAWRIEDQLQHITLTSWGAQGHIRTRPWMPRWLLALRSERITDAPAPEARQAAQDGAAPQSPTSAMSSFEAFYQQHERAIFGYLWRVCGDEQTANDLTQEVFLRAWRAFEKLRGYERPEAWLFRVATNLALNERRHQRLVGPGAPLEGHERASGDHATQLVERATLRAALESLPARQRAAFILRELYGHSCDEIADILGLTRAAAKMTLSRARHRLRTLYLKEDAE